MEKTLDVLAEVSNQNKNISKSNLTSKLSPASFEPLEQRTLMSVVTSITQLVPQASNYGGISQNYSGTITIDNQPITSGGIMILPTNSQGYILGGLQNGIPFHSKNYVSGYFNQDDATFWGFNLGETIGSPIIMTPFNPGTQGTITIDYAPLTPPWSRIPGDANKDGKVDISDLAILGGNWNMQGGHALMIRDLNNDGYGNLENGTWTLGADDKIYTPNMWGQGDFNSDGKIDISDLAILGGNWNSMGMGFSQPSELYSQSSQTPEPLIVSILAAGGLGILASRRKTQKLNIRDSCYENGNK